MGKRKRGRKTKKARKPQRSKRLRTIKIPTGGRRPKGPTQLTRCQSMAQATYGYAITFSPSYQKAHGTIVNVQQGKRTKRMREYNAERLWLKEAWGITPRKTSPQRL